MAKSAKPAPAEAEAPAKPKSKKLLLIIIGVLILGAGGGAGWWFFMKDSGGSSKHADAPKAAGPAEPPTFLVLEPFTVNLQHEESDQFLQIGITLKVAGNEQADNIRQNMAEIRSHMLFLLSSKKPSELIPIEGKKKLIHEIMVEVNNVAGQHAAAQKNVAHEGGASGVEAAHGGEANTGGVIDVLFTAFIIQ